MPTKKETLEGLQRIVRSEEPEFLKYQVDCCNNILKGRLSPPFTAPVLQLMKFRSECQQRLYEIYGIEYDGK